MGLSFQLTARVLLYAPSHRQDNTYHSLCYTSRWALAGTRNKLNGSTPWRINPTTHHTMSERSYHRAQNKSGCYNESCLYICVHEGSIRRPITPWANALTTELHLALGLTEYNGGMFTLKWSNRTLTYTSVYLCQVVNYDSDHNTVPTAVKKHLTFITIVKLVYLMYL